MHVHLLDLAARQDDVVAVWQLLRLGLAPWTLDHHREKGRRRRIHRGVYALTQGRLTRRQLWIAATLTTPDSVLIHASGGAFYGFRPFQARFEVVTRPGTSGLRRTPRLVICHS